MVSEPAHHSEVLRRIEEISRKIRELERDLYGSPQIKGQGVFERLDGLREELDALRSTYERERIESGALGIIEERIDKLAIDYRVMLVYLKAIAGAAGSLLVMALIAAVVGVLRFLVGG